MKKIVFVLLACLLLAVPALTAQSYTPLRTYVATLGPEFVLGTVGDSWTANAQIDGETQDWGGTDGVGGAAPYLKNLIWADPTTTQGATWTNRLAWRLGTHKQVTEAVGGAYLATTGATFSFQQDSSICGWVDDLAAFPCKVVIGYGGINNMMSTTVPTWATIRPMALGFAKLLLDQFPSSVPIIIPTLQPCSLRPAHYKKKTGTNAWTNLTWRQIGDNGLAIQALQTKFNTYLKDTLKLNLKAAGYDTSRIYVYDLNPKLLRVSTWTSGADAALYPLTLDADTTDTVTGFPGGLQADSTRWAALQFLRPEIDSDSIHCNQRGLRQIGDSLAKDVFGIDFDTWTAGPAKTLYVSKQTGNNWTNRLVATDPSTPLATLQAAIFRAWPGDSIAVIGAGNQALISSSTGKSLGAAEVRFTKQALRIGFASTAYYSGIYDSGSGVGINWHNFDLVSVADGCELSGALVKTGWPNTATAGVNYPKIDFDGMVLDGLKVRGYQQATRFPMGSGITFRNCTLKGGGATGAGQGGLVFYNYGKTLTNYIDRCTFYTDSNTVAPSATSATYGRPSFYPICVTGDSSRYAGWVRNSSFIGDSTNASTGMIYGWIDGVSFSGNTIRDYNIYNGAPVLMHSTARPAGVTLGDIKWVNNSFYFKTLTSVSNLIQVTTSGGTTDADGDSVVFVNNFMHLGGIAPSSTLAVFRVPIGTNHAKWWMAGNVIPTTACVCKSVAAATAITNATLVTNGATPATTAHGRNIGLLQNANYIVSATGDTVIFGGVLSSGRGANVYGPSAYGITTATQHASIGATQYTEDPYLANRVIGGKQDYARFAGHWPLLRLINNGVLPASTDSTEDKTDWYTVAKPVSPSDIAQYKLWIDEYFKLTKTSQKILWNVEGQSTGFQTYYGHYRWLDSLTNVGGTALGDSLDDATWHKIPKPLNPSDELQLYIYKKAFFQLPRATRNKMYWKVLAQATNFKDWDGYWAILKAIDDEEEGFVASDEYDSATWYHIPKPRNASDEAMLGYYMEEYFMLPNATRDKMYWTINQ